MVFSHKRSICHELIYFQHAIIVDDGSMRDLFLEMVSEHGSVYSVVSENCNEEPFEGYYIPHGQKPESMCGFCPILYDPSSNITIISDITLFISIRNHVTYKLNNS